MHEKCQWNYLERAFFRNRICSRKQNKNLVVHSRLIFNKAKIDRLFSCPFFYIAIPHKGEWLSIFQRKEGNHDVEMQSNRHSEPERRNRKDHHNCQLRHRLKLNKRYINYEEDIKTLQYCYSESRIMDKCIFL